MTSRCERNASRLTKKKIPPNLSLSHIMTTKELKFLLGLVIQSVYTARYDSHNYARVPHVDGNILDPIKKNPISEKLFAEQSKPSIH